MTKAAGRQLQQAQNNYLPPSFTMSRGVICKKFSSHHFFKTYFGSGTTLEKKQLKIGVFFFCITH